MPEGEGPNEEEMGLKPKDLEVPSEPEAPEETESAKGSDEAGVRHEVGETWKLERPQDIGYVIADALNDKRGLVETGAYLIQVEAEYRYDGVVDVMPDYEYEPRVVKRAHIGDQAMDVRAVDVVAFRAHDTLNRGYFETYLLAEISPNGVEATLLSPDLTEAEAFEVYDRVAGFS